MLTIKVFLAESGAIARLDKNFPLYQGQYQNVLLNAFVPLSLLPEDFKIQAPSQKGVISPYVAGTSVKVASYSLTRAGTERISKNYYLRFVKTLVDGGVEYALFERKLPKEFTAYSGSNSTSMKMIFNVENVRYGEVVNVAVTEQHFATLSSLATVVDATFLTKVEQKNADYTFRYLEVDGVKSWYLNGDLVTLADYGITAGPILYPNDNFTVKVTATESVVTQVATSQVVDLAVLPSSSLLDNDAPVDPTEIEEIEGEISAINGVLANKQDKVDNNLATADKSVVGAINELNGEVGGLTTIVEDHDQSIDGLETKVATNTSDISELKTIVGSGEYYIGTWNYASAIPPTANQVSTWVQQEIGRPPKGGDVVIVSLVIAGATDKTYKYIYNGTTWVSYEIPPIESASNGTKGLIAGTFVANPNKNVLVDIVDGEIENIYVKDMFGGGMSYAKLETIIANLMTKDWQFDSNFSGLSSGTFVVRRSVGAEKDGAGNVITSTYMPQSVGATKVFVKDYALPKEFNNVLYLTADGYSETIPDASSLYSESVVSSTIGDELLVDGSEVPYTVGDLKFQLADKNAYKVNFHIATDTEISGLSFRLEAYYKKPDETAVLVGVSTVSGITVDEDGLNLVFDDTFNRIEDILEVEVGDKIYFDLYVIRTSSTGVTFTVKSTPLLLSKFFLFTNVSSLVRGNVRQETGTSTTDTMSQDAITKFGTVSLIKNTLVDSVEYDTTDGITIYTSAEETNGLGTQNYEGQFSIPLVAGEGVSIDKSEDEEKIVIKNTGGINISYELLADGTYNMVFATLETANLDDTVSFVTINVPETATNGTITAFNEQLLEESNANYIMFNGIEFNFESDGSGVRTYVHETVSRKRTITITKSTGSWVLTETIS